MARQFLLQVRTSVQPIEKITLDDSSQSAYHQHSNIDRNVGGSIEIDCGATDSNIAVVETYETTTSGVTINTIFSDTITGIDYLFVKILSAASSGTPDVQISLDTGGNYRHTFSGVNKFESLRPAGKSGTAILIKSSGATTIANIIIILGLEA